MTDEAKEKPSLYVLMRDTPNGPAIGGYAYGLPWVEKALESGDICFQSREAAKEWWDRRYGS